ncbi:MAG: FAD-dependent oxidoreductase [bacterium]|nr:FAD-dependent oxidoreductase [bacterium]
MRRVAIGYSLFLLVLFGGAFGALLANETGLRSDVLIYGATPSGIAAAVSAAKGKRSVILVEPTNRIGGMMTSGLSYTDFRSFESLTGFFFDFSQRVEREYEMKYGVDSEQAKAAFRGTHGEPVVNLRVFQRMLAEHATIKVIHEQRLATVSTTRFVRGRRKIVSATFERKDGSTKTIQASVFIDASYEGDLMAAAGEPYHIGRESRRQYGETMAGDAQGNADGQVQGYNLRLIMTTVKSNQRQTLPPDGYDRADFVGVLPVFESSKLKHVFAADRSGVFRAHLPLMPNNKTDVNDTPHSPVRLSMPDINDAYPEGDQAIRREIIEQHYYYNIGLLYFLQNDEAVPPSIRADANRWKLCRDEFPETDGVSPQLYIREARRLIGQHVFTGRDTQQAEDDARSVLHRDSIAIGDYVHNCHGTGRIGSRFDGRHDGEFYKPIPPYQIPYGVIVPAKSTNLLVPTACSASHFGFGALRLEPIWCALGQAAGWAASLSLEEDTVVQNLNVAKLQSLLHADRSATIYVADVPPTSPHFAAVQWFGARGGLHGLSAANQPKPKSLGGQYSEAFPGHFVRLDAPLDTAFRQRNLTEKQRNSDDIKSAKTRGEFIEAIYQSQLPVDTQ